MPFLAQTLGGPYFKMSENKIELELKSTIDNVLSKLSHKLKRMINVQPGTGSQDVNIDGNASANLQSMIIVEPGTGSQDVNIDGNASDVLSKLSHGLKQPRTGSQDVKVIVEEIKTYEIRKQKFYNEHVMSKIGKEDKKKVVMNLGGYYLHEHMFVECFKPDGWMSNFVVSCLANLWNEEWGDKTIISPLAVQELQSGNGDRLAKELNKEVLGHTKLIFVPIRANYHWNLAMLDLTKKNV